MKKATLNHFARQLSDPLNCAAAMIYIKWPGGSPTCPKCQSAQTVIADRQNHFLQCADCETQFSYVADTFAEGSKWPLKNLLLGGFVLVRPDQFSIRNFVKVARIGLSDAQSIVDHIKQFRKRSDAGQVAVAPAAVTPADSPLRDLVAGSVPAQIVAATVCWWMDRTAQVAKAAQV